MLRSSYDYKLVYWLVIFSLLFIPISNSFFVVIKKTIKSVISYKNYKSTLNELKHESEMLSNEVKYYKSSQGIKSLVKERLNKVEEGELLIKLDE